MTNAMPVFINSLFPFFAKALDADAKSRIEEAREIFAAAAQETSFGDIAKSQIVASAQSLPNKNLAEIAAWHYERAVLKYRQALGKFSHAEKSELPVKYRRYVEKKIADCRARANAAYAGKLEAEKFLTAAAGK